MKSYTPVSLLSFFARRPFDALKAIKQSTTTTKVKQTITLKAAVFDNRITWDVGTGFERDRPVLLLKKHLSNAAWALPLGGTTAGKSQ